MKKLILFLFLSTSLFCFGQGKSALKDIQSIKFYGVDYSQVKVFGADESPAQVLRQIWWYFFYCE